MKTAIRIALALIALCVAPSPGDAQHSWLITAGRGWGPIDLGMTADEVVGILGRPKSATTAGGVHRVRYDTSVLTFVRPAGESAPRLRSIEVDDAASRTREGIHAGSSLQDVLRAYGDTQDNTQVNGDRPRGCLDLSLNSSDRYGSHSVQPNYQRMFLILDYAARGMEFDFLIPDVNKPALTVVLITVKAPLDKCRPLFSRGNLPAHP